MTLNEIAATAGVHASAVRRYFESREEIYLRLAATEWDGWATTVEGELDRAGTLPARDLAAYWRGHSPTGRCSATCSPTPR